MVWHGFTQMAAYADNAPLVIERAEGRELVDAAGNRYLDAISSLWVNTLGHHVPELDRALAEQAAKVAHTTMLGNGNTVVVELAEALGAAVPVDDPHVLFAGDGAVAVEQALKIAFQYWANRGERGRTTFLALGDAYHGDTIGSLSLGDGGVFSAVFEPLCFPVERTPGYVDPGWAAKACAAIEAHADELAAVVLEPLVQGAAGMLCASAADVGQVGETCRRAGALLICDEVATGFGRTGTLFASEQCGLRPDLLCLGKGITGGYLAMSATVASGEVFDRFLGPDVGPQTFFHGHSYGGNALAAAVALEHLRLVDEWGVLANVRARADQVSALLTERIAPRPEVLEVRQRGLMVGVELAPLGAGLRWGRQVCAGAVRRGVLLRPLGDVVVLMPPLTTTEDEITRIVDALSGGLDDLASPATAAPRHRGPLRPLRPLRHRRPTGPTVTWPERIRGELAQVVAEDRWRAPREFDARGPAGALLGRPVVSFASNDYLGLSAHPEVVRAAHDALDRWGAGAGASRLVTGSRPIHTELELELAAWKGTEAAVCFPTGFAANLGTLCALGGRDVRVLSDELNHASIIDGCRLSRSELAVYRHADMDHLEQLLAGREPSPAGAVWLPTIVVTDSVFSMDGDAAPLEHLLSLCAHHDALLVIDEAHAVLGPHIPPATGGGGEAKGSGDRAGVASVGTQRRTVVRVGTMSKTLGALGGFVAAAATSSTSSSTGPARTSSRPRCPRLTPPPPSQRSGSCAPTKGLP